jgi:hypothetical protein
MGEVGRNTKMTEDVVNRICEAISNGNTHKTACALAGISHTTFYRWIDENSEFSDSVKEAEATSEAFHVEQIRKASSSSWQASAWMLERRNNPEWGRKDKIDVTSKDEKIDGFKVVVINKEPDDT